ncbi:MAG: hypothetical protein ACXW30_05565 [Micavibrio sp.]
MNKYLKIFGLATALSITGIASAQAQMGNSHKTATRGEMTIPDNRGHVVVSPLASRAYACTTDKRLVLTHIFATAYHTTVGGTNKPLPVSEYLAGVVPAFEAAARKTHSSAYTMTDRSFDIPHSVKKAMSDYSTGFNNSHGTYLDWMIKIYTMAPGQSRLCK